MTHFVIRNAKRESTPGGEAVLKKRCGLAEEDRIHPKDLFRKLASFC
jgi:hypothetical protein